MFDRPILLWLLLAAPLVVAPGLLAARGGGKPIGGLISGSLRLATFVALVLMLAGLRVPFRAAANQMATVIAVDESRSIAPDQAQSMRAQIDEIRRASGIRDRVAVVGFGRDARLLTPLQDPRLPIPSFEGVDPDGTDIAGALTTAEGIFPSAAEKRLVLLTDGNETQGNVLDELPALAQDGVRIFTVMPPPSAVARVAITAFDAPGVVRAQTSFALRLDIQSEASRPVEANIDLSGDGAALGTRQVSLAPGLNRFSLPYRVDRSGAYLMQARIEVPAPLVAVNPTAEAAVSVIAPPRVLVISPNPPDSLIKALRARSYEVQTTAPHGLPVRPEDYLGYQAVIIANVPAEALDDAVQTALNRYVADLGGGLVVTGDTLRDYRFHDSQLEKVLPVSFEPQPPPPSREPIAVYMLIDRSNSMSYNSRYPAVRDGERIRYAKQAAVALLDQLDDTDYAGVIAFDSEPYVLGHLRPLGEDRDELVSRIERLEPGGGTDFKEALEVAEREIQQSGINVREVILLTDGDTNRQYHDHDQLMTDYAKDGIPVSTIRIGPDLENLRLLQDFAHVTGGVFYRVEDITKLPQLLVHLTHEAENYKLHERAHIDFGNRSAVLNGIAQRDLPPIDFFAMTQAKDGAEVPLIIRKGPHSAPLLATWQYELGRTAIFSADPDSLGSLAWIRWNHYAEFWSQMVSWVAREGDSGPFSLRVRNSGDGALVLDAQKTDPLPVSNLFCRITGPNLVTDVAMSQIGTASYEGESVPLKRGKYGVTLLIKAGDTERVLLRREVAVIGSQAVDAAELRLKPANDALLRTIATDTGGEFDAPVAHIVHHSGATVTAYESIDRILLPLAILALLLEVLIRRRYLGE
ncbi:MAG TPA: VWA domain-containing protein [Candidatus Binataceae bacterium]|nr:VWA domain-containing protein [Candidatus Binataceae bacterium]